MLLSMTGFGNASQQSEVVSVSAELKAVNNRYLKVSMRLPDFLARFEPDIEKLVRENIARGSVQLSFRVRLQSQHTGYSIDRSVLQRYMEQVAALPQFQGAAPGLSDLLPLPGVVAEADVTPDLTSAVWPVLQATLKEALDHFHEFRRREGESMKDDLKRQAQTIADRVGDVEKSAPSVVAEYRTRLLERVRKAMTETSADIGENDVIREVALFADKCDINEEITRLHSHLDQFHNFLNSEQSLGRKLEFLGQEMFREINTIGSKANNVEIAHNVVEMKAAIERIREILQNVE